MSKIIINGGNVLNGTVKISGSKNSALPILAATLLSNSKNEIIGVPDLSDIRNMLELLSGLGAVINKSKDILCIDCSKIIPDAASDDVAQRLRASFLVFGPLLAKTGRAKIALPGGCRIGARPVDLHLKGFTLMGAKIQQGHGFVEAKCKRLHGATVYLDFPSVGATENLIMAASLAQGETILENAAVEPEIADLATFINAMGGNVIGAGTDTIIITGVEKLEGCSYKIIPDRIEAGTFITAAGITGGNVCICNVIPEHLKPIIAKIRECGVNIDECGDCINVSPGKKIKSSDIKTMPYPGFPTDMQAVFSSLMSVADGTSMVIETIFENRFMHIPELQRMGANVKIEGRTAVIEGRNMLTGAKVSATDLRAGAALSVAGLCAVGTTEIDNIEYIERGYENFVEKFSGLGADITKIT